MKTIFVFVFVLLAAFAALATNVASYPAFGDNVAEAEFEGADTQDEPAAVEEGLEEHGVRMKRATCDLLSFQSKWVTPNHAACAAHCLALFKGFKGGRCRDGICVCRK